MKWWACDMFQHEEKLVNRSGFFNICCLRRSLSWCPSRNVRRVWCWKKWLGFLCKEIHFVQAQIWPLVKFQTFTARVPTSYLNVVTLHEPVGGSNGTFFAWKAHIDMQYIVTAEEWHNVAFQLCSPESEGPVAEIDGEVTFKNPYGFIPAELYGFLPFEVCDDSELVFFCVCQLLLVSIGCSNGGILFVWCIFHISLCPSSGYTSQCGKFLTGFIYCVLWLQESTLPVHKAVMIVFVFALAEATTWFAAYQTINSNGQPYCCPFPPTVVASLILQVASSFKFVL